MKMKNPSRLDISCPTASPGNRDLWRSMLEWHMTLGVDEVIGETPVNAFESRDSGSSSFPGTKPCCDTSQHQSQVSASVEATSPVPPASLKGEGASHSLGRFQPPMPLSDTRRPVTNGIRSSEGANALAAACDSLVDLQRALQQFEGCSLKRTATNTVFADGNPHAGLMIIGEAPGRDEDREGVPFVGASGQLLDRMLASIGQTRETFYITNLLPWRPPGNRAPTDSEVTACLPFLVRHIELVQPKILLLVGGLAAKNLFARSEGITRLRGKWQTWTSPHISSPIPSLATFHPAYLLRTPAQKRLAWRDLLEVKQKLRTVGVS